jgi:hypothetical protein
MSNTPLLSQSDKEANKDEKEKTLLQRIPSTRDYADEIKPVNQNVALHCANRASENCGKTLSQLRSVLTVDCSNLDRLKLGKNPCVITKLQTLQDQYVRFSDRTMKYNSKYEAQGRIIMLTERALYNIKPPAVFACTVQRRLPLSDIFAISISEDHFDGLVAVHVGAKSIEWQRGDFLFRVNRKFAFVSALSQAMHDMGLTIDVKFTDTMAVRMKKKRPSSVLVFVEPDFEDGGNSFTAAHDFLKRLETAGHSNHKV